VLKPAEELLCCQLMSSATYPGQCCILLNTRTAFHATACHRQTLIAFRTCFCDTLSHLPHALNLCATFRSSTTHSALDFLAAPSTDVTGGIACRPQKDHLSVSGRLVQSAATAAAVLCTHCCHLESAVPRHRHSSRGDGGSEGEGPYKEGGCHQQDC
jgi:hypothetical protein